MPSTYRNTVKTLTATSITDIYECPQGATAILKTISALNTNASIAAVTRKPYLKDGEVIVLESKDKLRMTAGTANYFDIFVSFLEIT